MAGAVGEKLQFELKDGRTVAVRYNEANADFPIASVGEAARQGNWSVFGPTCHAGLCTRNIVVCISFRVMYMMHSKVSVIVFHCVLHVL